MKRALYAALGVVLGIEPEPFLELTATFASEAEARRWEMTWPELRGKLRTNPYVVLGGLAPLVARLTSTREGGAVSLEELLDESVRHAAKKYAEICKERKDRSEETPNLSPEDIEAIRQATPLKRIGAPSDAINLVLYLLEGTDFATGAVFRVDGGRFLGTDNG